MRAILGPGSSIGKVAGVAIVISEDAAARCHEPRAW